MEKKKLFKISSIVLVPALLISILIPAFAATAGSGADKSVDKWIIKAPMTEAKKNFQTEVINGQIYAIGGISNNMTTCSVEEYDPASNQWSKKSAMNDGRVDFQTEVVNGKIYAIGGFDDKNGQVLNSVEEYDPATDKWTKKRSMSEGRYDFQTAIVGGKIYAMGGYHKNNTPYLSSVEMYDPTTDTWTSKAAMHSCRKDFQTEVINGKIFAIGGSPSSGNFTGDVEMYDPATDTWTLKAAMRSGRWSFHTEVISGKIYAVGGCEYIGKIEYPCYQVEEYDPSLNKWTTKSSMSTSRKSFQTEIIDGKIFAIGGYNNEGSQSSSEVYDPERDTWAATASMSEGRCGFQTAIINGKIYAVGGDGNNKRLNSVEEYYAAPSITLTVTPSPDKVKIGSEFTTTVAIHKGTNICAEDIKLTYDTNLFDYEGSEAKTGLKIMNEDSKTTPGTIRFVLSCLGKDNAATGDKDLITLKFKAKKAGQGKVKITKGRVADNATLEMDVAAADCGEATITVESNKDVNRSGDVTLLDLGIDGWYYGMDAKDTDSTKYDADVMPNGKIDDDDLSEITQGILSNNKYPNN